MQLSNYNLRLGNYFRNWDKRSLSHWFTLETFSSDETIAGVRYRKKPKNSSNLRGTGHHASAATVQGVTWQLPWHHQPPPAPSWSQHWNLTATRYELPTRIGARKPPLMLTVKYWSLVILVIKSSNWQDTFLEIRCHLRGKLSRQAKPFERRGRKAADLIRKQKMAELPKDWFLGMFGFFVFKLNE